MTILRLQARGHRNHLAAAALLALTACADGGDSGDGTEICGPNAPEIVSLYVDDCALATFVNDDGDSETHPSVLLKADVVDPDGDLNPYGMRVWYDDVLDGRVLPNTAYLEVYGTLDDQTECGVRQATLGIRFALNGAEGAPPWGERLELGVAVVDAAQHTSEGLLEIVFTMPEQDGSCDWTSPN